MVPKTAELIAVLDELVVLLRGCREDHWARWIQRDRDALASADFGGVLHLLTAYGGMGSFNDLLLHPANGHDLREAEVEAMNARLADLRTAAYALAEEIKRAAVFE